MTIRDAAHTALVRAEGYGHSGLTHAEAFVHKHSKGPAIPIITTVAGFFLLGPLGALIGAGAGYAGGKAVNKHLEMKASGTGPLPPTGYHNLSAPPSRQLQSAAAAYLKSLGGGPASALIGKTKKVAMDGHSYIFRIEVHPPAPERGLPGPHPGVTVYEKA